MKDALPDPTRDPHRFFRLWIGLTISTFSYFVLTSCKISQKLLVAELRVDFAVPILRVLSFSGGYKEEVTFQGLNCLFIVNISKLWVPSPLTCDVKCKLSILSINWLNPLHFAKFIKFTCRNNHLILPRAVS